MEVQRLQSTTLVVATTTVPVRCMVVMVNLMVVVAQVKVAGHMVVSITMVVESHSLMVVVDSHSLMVVVDSHSLMVALALISHSLMVVVKQAVAADKVARLLGIATPVVVVQVVLTSVVYVATVGVAVAEGLVALLCVSAVAELATLQLDAQMLPQNLHQWTKMTKSA